MLLDTFVDHTSMLAHRNSRVEHSAVIRGNCAVVHIFNSTGNLLEMNHKVSAGYVAIK